MIDALWHVLVALAPWVLLGAAVAGVLHVALPEDFVKRHLGRKRRGGVAKAVALGVPLPLCSCGVIPAGLGLRRDGASRGAAVGFLISTPQTGVDSILVSASFLGWPFALFKVGAAAVTGLVGGWLVDRGDHEPDAEPVAAPKSCCAPKVQAPVAPAKSCCASEAEVQAPVAPAKSCCAGKAKAAPPPAPRASALLAKGAAHATEVLRSIWGWLVFGIVVSALITAAVPPSAFAGLTGYGSVLAMGAVLGISVPLYVCATASVPIAAALVAGGFPPGAALVFLMAGPATNLATIGAVHRALGRRALVVYLATIIVGSLVAGFAFDFVLSTAAPSAPHSMSHGAWWEVGSVVILLGALAWFAGEWVRARLSVRRAGSKTASAAT